MHSHRSMILQAMILGPLIEPNQQKIVIQISRVSEHWCCVRIMVVLSQLTFSRISTNGPFQHRRHLGFVQMMFLLPIMVNHNIIFTFSQHQANPSNTFTSLLALKSFISNHKGGEKEPGHPALPCAKLSESLKITGAYPSDVKLNLIFRGFYKSLPTIAPPPLY